jgi:hypothetical protein
MLSLTVSRMIGFIYVEWIIRCENLPPAVVFDLELILVSQVDRLL